MIYTTRRLWFLCFDTRVTIDGPVCVRRKTVAHTTGLWFSYGDATCTEDYFALLWRANRQDYIFLGPGRLTRRQDAGGVVRVDSNSKTQVGFLVEP